MNKLKVIILGVLMMAAALIVSGAVAQRHALACEVLPLLNYHQVSRELFLDPDMSEAQAHHITSLVSLASKRISTMYGAPKSTPRVIVTSSTQAAARWGANETASMHRMPWRACIVLGPEGQNVDVIAHEWLHAEMQQRVGLLRWLMEVPTWFDEGAGLTVDYRAPFLPENIALSESDIERVKALGYGKAFFSGDIRKNYQAARIAVSPLITAESFYHDLERIAHGESFESVFLKTN